MVSPSGPLVAQMDCSSGWKSLKQKPSFLEGLSISSHVLSRTVPTQWLLCRGTTLVRKGRGNVVEGKYYEKILHINQIQKQQKEQHIFIDSKKLQTL